MHTHYKLFKPDGYLSQFVNNGPRKKRIRLLGELGEFPSGTMAVGRLDLKSEGLLLLTTDGKFSDHVCRSGIQKEYYAQLDGLVSEADLDAIRPGIDVQMGKKKISYKPCKARILIDEPLLPPRNKSIRNGRHGPTSWISLTITEGKFHQVRKMTAAIGFPTLRLVRVRIGPIHLGEMNPGEHGPIDPGVFPGWD